MFLAGVLACLVSELRIIAPFFLIFAMVTRYVPRPVQVVVGSTFSSEEVGGRKSPVPIWLSIGTGSGWQQRRGSLRECQPKGHTTLHVYDVALRL